MQALTDLVETVLSQTQFEGGHWGTVSADEIRAMYRQGGPGNHSALFVKTVVRGGPLAVLVDTVGHVLERYVDPATGRVGTGLVDLMGGRMRAPTVAEFTHQLVRAAATLGSVQAIGLVLGWADGEPLQYQTHALLTGVTVNQPLVLDNGVRITRLPTSENQLSRHLPPVTLATRSYRDLLGGVLLTIDCTAGPALYQPGNDSTHRGHIQEVFAGNGLPGFSFDRFCEALSLAAGECIRHKYEWDNFGRLYEFNTGILGGLSEHTTVPRTTGSTTVLLQEHLNHAREIHVRRNGTEDRHSRLNTAIHRWINSKREESDLTDRFIELRIAFEALYLKDEGGGFSFHVATRAAWHLGDDANERLHYFKTVKDTYQVGSSAAHGRNIKDTPNHQELLAAAQETCRQGILKRLVETKEPEWTKLILGGGSE